MSKAQKSKMFSVRFDREIIKSALLSQYQFLPNRVSPIKVADMWFGIVKFTNTEDSILFKGGFGDYMLFHYETGGFIQRDKDKERLVAMLETALKDPKNLNRILQSYPGTLNELPSNVKSKAVKSNTDTAVIPPLAQWLINISTQDARLLIHYNTPAGEGTAVMFVEKEFSVLSKFLEHCFKKETKFQAIRSAEKFEQVYKKLNALFKALKVTVDAEGNLGSVERKEVERAWDTEHQIHVTLNNPVIKVPAPTYTPPKSNEGLPALDTPAVINRLYDYPADADLTHGIHALFTDRCRYVPAADYSEFYFMDVYHVLTQTEFSNTCPYLLKWDNKAEPFTSFRNAYFVAHQTYKFDVKPNERINGVKCIYGKFEAHNSMYQLLAHLHPCRADAIDEQFEKLLTNVLNDAMQCFRWKVKGKWYKLESPKIGLMGGNGTIEYVTLREVNGTSELRIHPFKLPICIPLVIEGSRDKRDKWVKQYEWTDVFYYAQEGLLAEVLATGGTWFAKYDGKLQNLSDKLKESLLRLLKQNLPEAARSIYLTNVTLGKPIERENDWLYPDVYTHPDTKVTFQPL